MVREAYANLNWAYGSAIAIVLFGMALSVIGPTLCTNTGGTTYEQRKTSNRRRRNGDGEGCAGPSIS